MKKQRILLAAGIFYPDVGGPAIHVMKIAERLTAEGFKVSVLAYGDDSKAKPLDFRVIRVSRQWPKPIQWVLYFFYALCETAGSAVVYAFDPTAAGIPAYLASKLLGRPLLLRLGGDPIWERTVEKNKRFLTIEEYYKKGYQRKDAPLLYKLIVGVLKRARAVVVYNQFFKDFFCTHFHALPGKIHIVKNPVFKRESASEILSNEPTIIFAGRFVSYKNLPFVMRAFDNVRSKLGRGRLLLIGDGPEKDALLKLKAELKEGKFIEFKDKLAQDALFEEIKRSAFAIAPALNEFNPNFILEALSFGKPALISRGNGLSVALPEEFLFDPFDQRELEAKLESLLNPENYKRAVNKIKEIPMGQSWENVTDAHLNLINQICQK